MKIIYLQGFVILALACSLYSVHAAPAPAPQPFFDPISLSLSSAGALSPYAS